MDDTTGGQLGQMYRVLMNDKYLDSETAACIVDALTADVARDPEHAQAIIWDEVDAQEVESYLWRDCTYRAYHEACAARVHSVAWLDVTFRYWDRRKPQWKALEAFCRKYALETSLEMVQRWTARPAMLVEVAA